MSGLLDKFPVVIEIPVAWGEMDALGHVNNIVYFRYFESARIAYMRRIEFIASLEQMDVGPILGAIDCRFKMPITFPDTLAVGVRTIKIESDRFVVEHCVVSQTAQRVAAIGEGVIVAYDYRAKKKAHLPAQVRQMIEVLEQSVERGK